MKIGVSNDILDFEFDDFTINEGKMRFYVA